MLTETTAELALALTFAAARRVVEGDTFMRGGQYKGWLPTLFVGNLLQASRGMGEEAVAWRHVRPWHGLRRPARPSSAWSDPAPRAVARPAPPVQNKVVGIVGAGRIGTAYARMMVEGHKCDLVYFDPYPNAFLEQYVR